MLNLLNQTRVLRWKWNIEDSWGQQKRQPVRSCIKLKREDQQMKSYQENLHLKTDTIQGTINFESGGL